MSEIDDVYKLSDEEFLKQTEEQAYLTSEPESTEQPPVDEQSQETVSVGDSNNQGDEQVNTGDSETKDENINESVGTVQGTDESTDTNQETTNSSSSNNDNGNVNSVDYESFYKRLTSPIKANGKEIKLDNPDDIIRLVQQGVNYSKNMQELKPLKNLHKTLQQHGLTEPDKLAFVIDLVNKKPEAIAKLIKDADIDLYSFDTDQAEQYKPVNPIVESSPLEDVLSTIQQESPQNYTRLLEHIQTQWDSHSKQVLQQTPNVLLVLNEHIQSGLFEKITNAIEYEQMLGRMQNMSFLDMYRAIEPNFLQSMDSNQAYQQQAQQQQQSFTAPRPTVQQNSTPSNTEQKRKTAPPQSTTNQVEPVDNVWALSDEEIMKRLGVT